MVANLMVTASTAQPQANPPGWVDVIDHQHIANGPHRSTIRGRVSRGARSAFSTAGGMSVDGPTGSSAGRPDASVTVGRNALSGIRSEDPPLQALMMLAQRYGQEVARDLWHYLGPAPGCTY